MAKELTATAAGSASVSVLGAWELRAGSQSTTEWLDGAADVTYPGGGPGTFNASNSDGANGYDAAPKMALLSITTASGSAAVTLAGGISAVLTTTGAQTTGTAAAFKLATSGKVVTLTGATAETYHVIVMYN